MTIYILTEIVFEDLIYYQSTSVKNPREESVFVF